MAEFLTMDEANDKFASKGKGNAGLTLGIIGTALAGLGFAHGGFGGSSSCNSDYPTAYQVQEKQCAENLALTNSIWQTRVTDLQEKFDLYTRLDNKISALAQSQATVNAQLPLMFQLANVTSERYTDDSVHRAERCQTNVNFALQSEIAKKIDGTLGLPIADLITGVPTMPNLQYVVTGCNGGATA